MTYLLALMAEALILVMYFVDIGIFDGNYSGFRVQCMILSGTALLYDSDFQFRWLHTLSSSHS